MWYLIGIFILAVGLLISCNFNVKTQNKNQTNIINSEQIIITDDLKDTIIPMYSKKDIEIKLKKLAETPPPDKLSFGAKCYKMAGAPETASYTCPVCEKVTKHKVKNKSKDYNKTKLIQWGINACRNEIEKIKEINIKLDESQFCKNCSPDIDEPQLCLLVNINNESDTTKICNINHNDIKLISEFLNDELKHKGKRDKESPLVNYISRIQELLGIKLQHNNN